MDAYSVGNHGCREVDATKSFRVDTVATTTAMSISGTPGENGWYTRAVTITLSRSGDQLVLQVGAWRRNLVLPRLLLDAPTQGARMEDRVLKVRFAEPPRAVAGGVRNG